MIDKEKYIKKLKSLLYQFQLAAQRWGGTTDDDKMETLERAQRKLEEDIVYHFNKILKEIND